MNEKIKEFIGQCEIVKYDSSCLWARSGGFDAEKFAELIVRECANACLSATKEGSSVHLVSVAYADAVKRHFGVEE
jgi:hypothetical protein